MKYREFKKSHEILLKRFRSTKSIGVRTLIKNDIRKNNFLIKALENFDFKLIETIIEIDKHSASYISCQGVNINEFEQEGFSIFYTAVRRGLDKVVKFLIDAGADLDEYEKDGKTALNSACFLSLNNIVELLLDAGADVNKETKHGFNSLYAACIKNNEFIVKILLDKGANVEKYTKGSFDNYTALQLASKNGFNKIVELILSKNVSRDNIEIALYLARFRRKTETANILAKELEKGKYKKPKDELTAASLIESLGVSPSRVIGSSERVIRYTPRLSPNEASSIALPAFVAGRAVRYNVESATSGVPVIEPPASQAEVDLEIEHEINNALSAFTFSGDLESDCNWFLKISRCSNFLRFKDRIVEQVRSHKLLERGLSEFNFKAVEAVIEIDEEAFSNLLERGFNIDAIIKDGLNILHAASRDGSIKVVRELLRLGAKVEEFSMNPGIAALYFASKAGNIEIVRELLDAGAIMVPKVSNKSCSPMHIACSRDHFEVVKEFLDRGCEVDLVFIDGTTPLHCASRVGSTKIAMLLLDRGAKINSLTKDNTSPLGFACLQDNIEVIRLLLDRGAEVNTCDTYSNTPLLSACRKGYIDIVKLLIERGAVVNRFNHRMNHPLNEAFACGNLEIVKIFLENGAFTKQIEEISLALAISALDVRERFDKSDPLYKVFFNTIYQKAKKENFSTILSAIEEAFADDGDSVLSILDGGAVKLSLNPIALDNVYLAEKFKEIKRRCFDNFNDSRFKRKLLSKYYDECKDTFFADKLRELIRDRGFLTQAIKFHDLKLMEVITFIDPDALVLIKDKINVNELFDRKRKLLIVATLNQKINLIKALLRAGADVDVVDSKRQTSLHIACSKGMVDICMVLLSAGANLNKIDNKGKKPLNLVQKDLLRRLIISGTDLRAPLVSRSEYRGSDLTAVDIYGFPAGPAAEYFPFESDLRLVRIIYPVLAPGFYFTAEVIEISHPLGKFKIPLVGDFHEDVNTILDFYNSNENVMSIRLNIIEELRRFSFLRVALSDFNFEVAEKILDIDEEGILDLYKNKFDANLVTRDFMSPLQAAARNGNARVVNGFLKVAVQFSTIFASSIVSNTKTMYEACRFGHIEIVRNFLESRFELDTKDVLGMTPLHVVSRWGHLDIVRLLLRRGASVNIFSNDMWTPLSLAFSEGYSEIVILLFYNGAEINQLEKIKLHDIENSLLKKGLIDKNNPMYKVLLNWTYERAKKEENSEILSSIEMALDRPYASDNPVEGGSFSAPVRNAADLDLDLPLVSAGMAVGGEDATGARTDVYSDLVITQGGISRK